MLRLGASVHSKTADGRTPLHFAARTGCQQTIKLLLAAGAGVDEHDSQGWTAVHFAACRGHAEALRELLLAGADPLRETCCTAATGDAGLPGQTPRGLLEGRPTEHKGQDGRERCLQLLLAAEVSGGHAYLTLLLMLVPVRAVCTTHAPFMVLWLGYSMRIAEGPSQVLGSDRHYATATTTATFA